MSDIIVVNNRETILLKDSKLSPNPLNLRISYIEPVRPTYIDKQDWDILTAAQNLAGKDPQYMQVFIRDGRIRSIDEKEQYDKAEKDIYNALNRNISPREYSFRPISSPTSFIQARSDCEKRTVSPEPIIFIDGEPAFPRKETAFPSSNFYATSEEMANAHTAITHSNTLNINAASNLRQ